MLRCLPGMFGGFGMQFLWSQAREKAPSPLRLLRLGDRITPTAGQLDPTFGAAGLVQTRLPAPTDDYGRAAAVDGLGRVTVAGYTSAGSHEEFAISRYTAAGAIDTSFGGNGIVTVGFGSTNAKATGMAIDSQGRVVVAGYTNYGDAFAVVRLTTSGALDTTFDGDGKLTVDFGGFQDQAFGVAVDSQDRVVVAGRTSIGSTFDFAVARLTVAGALDASFDADGKLTYSFGTFDEFATGVAIDSQDRVVVAGSMSTGSNYDFAVSRLTIAGAFDAGFDSDGKQTIRFGTSDDFATGVAVDSQDRVVVAGYTVGANDRIAIACLTAAGVPDSGFGTDGKQTVVIGASRDRARSVAIDAADRVIVAGDTQNGSNSAFAVARLTADGVLDPGFDADGKLTVTVGTSDDVAYGVAVDTVGRVVVAGRSANGSNHDFAIIRLSTAGTLDPAFNADGKQTTELNAIAYATGYAVTLDSSGRTVVAGYQFNGANDDFVIVRYLTNGTLDVSFGNMGVVSIAFFASADIAYGIAVDSQDRVVVAGYTVNGSENDFAVARLTAAGTFDASFDADGKQTIDFGASEDIATAVAIDSQDRVIVAGYTHDGQGSYFDVAVARLTAGGALDASFDTDGKQTVDFAASTDYAFGVAVDSADRVIVAGHTSNGATVDFAVARLTAGGALDAAFDADGKQTCDFGSSNDSAFGVAVDSTDRILVAGSTGAGPNQDFAIARLTASGALDADFDADGKLTLAFGMLDDAASGVAVDSQDRVVVVGQTSNGSNNDIAVVRLTAAGVPDSTFDGDGKQTVAFGAANDFAFAVAVDLAGRVVASGRTVDRGTALAVARLTGDTTNAVVQVNDGSAQRSTVTSFQVVFSEPVTFPNGMSAAFQLQRTGPGMPAGTVNLNFVHAGNRVTITFNDPTFAPGTERSLIDGRYTLTMVAPNIHSANGILDGDLNATPGGDLVQLIHRLFGDANGDGNVDIGDFGEFRNAFGGGSQYFFDADGDGDVDAHDFSQFRARFGTSV